MKNFHNSNLANGFVPSLFIVLLTVINSQAQERISIKDPDISFHYTLPVGWANYDDDYYHYIFLPESNDSEGMTSQFSITYFENNCPSLEDCFLGEMNGGIQMSFPAAKIGRTGSTYINGTNTRWLEFTNVETIGPIKMTFNYTMYVFIQNDHYFVLSSKAPEGKNLVAQFTAILNSFHSEKNG